MLGDDQNKARREVEELKRIGRVNEVRSDIEHRDGRVQLSYFFFLRANVFYAMAQSRQRFWGFTEA